MKTKLLLFLLFSLSMFAQTNLVPNAGFENWTNNTTLPNWTAENNVTQNTIDYVGGINSVKLSFPNSSLIPKITTQVSLSAGVTYTIKFKYKYLSSNYNESHPIALNISKSGSLTTLSNSFFATDNNWTRSEATFTPDQNLSYDLSISLLTTDGIGFNAAIDDVQVYVQGTEQYTLIPDANFEQKLIRLGIDYGTIDGRVLTASISSLNALDARTNIIGAGLFIKDMTGIQDFTALTYLDCSGHEITSLNIGKNTALTTLVCSNNQLTTLDISKNIALTSLTCSNNKLTDLDVSGQKNLTNLLCGNNALTSLDVSKNIALTILNCRSNLLESLDISKNVALTSLYCNSNPLTALNLKNGNNRAFYWDFSYHIDFTSNPQLLCISVDDVIYSNKNWYNKRDSKASYSQECDGKYTVIPDLNFEKKLIALWIDSGQPDGKVLTASISSQKTLNVSASGITDLTGIEDFTQLTSLNCSDSKLTSLNISKNLKLTDLDCSKNQLTALNVTKHTDLATLRCANNKELGFLDVSNNVNLAILDCESTKLRTLNLDKNLKLAELNCSYNALTSLIIPPNFEFTYLDCSYNRLPNLDVSNNTNLAYFDCSYNKLTSLDVSTNNSLTNFNCRSNNLFNLNVKNGNNGILKTCNFRENPNLKCISVDNISNADFRWGSSKDPKANYGINCNSAVAYTLIPDAAFEQKLIDIGIDTDGKNGKVLTDNIASLTALDISSSKIVNLSGIQDFVSLTYLDCGLNSINYPNFSENVVLTTLYCQKNPITTLDLSKNIFLTYLDCSSNRLSKLDVSKNTALTYLNVSDNSAYSEFTSLDVSTNIALKTLNCSKNKLTTLDVTKNPALTTFNCSGNQIEGLDVSKNVLLTKFNCNNNKLWNLNLKNGNNINLDVTNSNFIDNSILTCIQVDDAAFSNANWSGLKDAAVNFDESCNIPYTLIPDINFENKLIALKIDSGAPDGKIATSRISFIDVLNVGSASIADLTGIQDFTALTKLDCRSNLLTTINISQNTALTDLFAQDNKLTTINTANNPALELLYIYNNELTSLDITTNSKLSDLFCMSNKLTVLNVSKNRNLNDLRCGSNLLTNLDFSSNPILNAINCSDNNLSVLNIKNGSNEFIYNDYITLDFRNNPSLKCIQVDDENYSNKNWTERKDATAVYSTSCSSLGIEESVFSKVVVHPNPTKDVVHVDNIALEKATIYNTLGQLVKTVTLDSGDTSNTIDLSGLSKGVYYIYLISGDAASAKKIIIE